MSDTNNHFGPSFASFAPQGVIEQMQHWGAMWAEGAREQLDHWAGATQQLEGWQREGMQRATEATDEMAKLVKSSLEYGNTLAEQWRTSSVEAFRRTLELVTPKA
ncbi:MAG: hypothetical protein AB1Z98_32435 [Nannocystaceae bacterium]